MINRTDRKLILALQENGRTPNIKLSSLLGIHTATIAKKIKQLEKEDIIKIRALPNPFKLGYLAQAFLAIKAKRDKIEDICYRLNQNFNVNLVVTSFGRFDILAIAYFPTWEKLLSFVSSDLSATNGVQSIETFLIKEIKKRYYGITIDDKSPAKIDEIDQQIIEKLTENGRYKLNRLADELGISPPTCLRRLSRLLAEKVIEIKAIPNPSKIGYIANAFMLLKVQADKLEDICEALTLYKDIFLVMTLYNSYDILIGFNATSPERLYSFKNEILNLDGIINDEIIIRAEIKKRYYGGFLE